MRVFAWDANIAVDPRLYKLSEIRAAEEVGKGKARYVTPPDGRLSIQLEPPVEVLLERSARNSLVPFGRGVIGKLKHPPNLNYPVPACGAHTRLVNVKAINYEPWREKVSAS
jgi:hypothetical protein